MIIVTFRWDGMFEGSDLHAAASSSGYSMGNKSALGQA